MAADAVSHSESQTGALAAGLSRLLSPGDVVFLKGELGTGKTCFIRAAARELGVTEPVTSPSFAMGQTYAGRVIVHHLDLYRLAEFKPEDFTDFEPFFTDDAITFIEWPEQAQPFLESPTAVVNLYHVDEHSRRIVIESGNAELMSKLEDIIAELGH